MSFLREYLRQELRRAIENCLRRETLSLVNIPQLPVHVLVQYFSVSLFVEYTFGYSFPFVAAYLTLALFSSSTNEPLASWVSTWAEAIAKPGTYAV